MFAGVYTTWDEAKKHSQGVKGASCKKFPDRASAEAFALPNGAGTATSSTSRAEAPAPLATPARAPLPGTAPAAAPAPAAGGRIYLQVPFEEKEEAKALGARWDPARKKWYAASTGDFARLTKWPVVREDAPPPARPPQLDKVPTLFLPAEERKRLASRDTGGLSLYTDGSCLGNTNVASKSCPAGWGVVVVGEPSAVAPQGLLLEELFGPVVLDSASDKFLGAEVGSNNTGELSGICEALLWLRDWEHSFQPATICYDSVYAAKTTTKEFNANKNKQLVKSAQTLFEEVKRTRKVTMKHVKGHSGHKWNEAVDRLAKRGAAGEHCSEGRWKNRRPAAPRVEELRVVEVLDAATAGAFSSPVLPVAAGPAEEAEEPAAKRRRLAAD